MGIKKKITKLLKGSNKSSEVARMQELFPAPAPTTMNLTPHEQVWNLNDVENMRRSAGYDPIEAYFEGWDNEKEDQNSYDHLPQNVEMFPGANQGYRRKDLWFNDNTINTTEFTNVKTGEVVYREEDKTRFGWIDDSKLYFPIGKLVSKLRGMNQVIDDTGRVFIYTVENKKLVYRPLYFLAQEVINLDAKLRTGEISEDQGEIAIKKSIKRHYKKTGYTSHRFVMLDFSDYKP